MPVTVRSNGGSDRTARLRCLSRELDAEGLGDAHDGLEARAASPLERGPCRGSLGSGRRRARPASFPLLLPRHRVRGAAGRDRSFRVPLPCTRRWLHRRPGTWLRRTRRVSAVLWPSSWVLSKFSGQLHGAADVPLLGRFVSGVEHDDDDPTPAHEVQPLPRSIVDAHLRQLAFDGLPVTETSRRYVPKASGNTRLSADVLQVIQPGYGLLSLEDRAHAVVCPLGYGRSRQPPWCGLPFAFSRPPDRRQIVATEPVAGRLERRAAALVPRSLPRHGWCPAE